MNTHDIKSSIPNESVLKSRDLWAFNQLMSISSSEGDMKATFEVFKKIKEHELVPDENTYKYLIMVCK